jgi:hypothetical protein
VGGSLADGELGRALVGEGGSMIAVTKRRHVSSIAVIRLRTDSHAVGLRGLLSNRGPQGCGSVLSPVAAS